MLTGRREAPLKETARLAGTAGDRAVPVTSDVTDPDAVDDLFAEIDARFGRLDLLFNNAADVMPYTPTEEVSAADWHRVMDSVATGTFLCSRAAFRLMKRQSPRGGRIINNGAPSAQVPRPDSIAFTAAKHAVAGLTRSLSLDGRRHDISMRPDRHRQCDTRGPRAARRAPGRRFTARGAHHGHPACRRHGVRHG